MRRRLEASTRPRADALTRRRVDDSMLKPVPPELPVLAQAEDLWIELTTLRLYSIVVRLQITWKMLPTTKHSLRPM